MNQEQTHLQIAEVLLPGPFNHGFDYLFSDDSPLQRGDIVKVPFGSRQLYGVVWTLKDTSTTPKLKLKFIANKISWAQLRQEECDFIDWMAAYTLSPRGGLIKMVFPVPQVFEPDKRNKNISRPLYPNPQHILLHLEKHQQEAVKSISASLKSSAYHCLLLDGVTGAGKTEVYFEAIASALNQSKQVLILLPEISLTPQWLERFQNRFGVEPVVWNSAQTPAQRRKAWKFIATGEARVVVGARSALFLHYHQLGLLIVDEEHDQSYKQEEGIIYHARDMAVAKALHLKISIVLVSATPSLESLLNVSRGKYHLLKLPTRHGAAQFPQVSVVDLKESQQRSSQRQWLSTFLQQAISDNLKAGEQTLLFLNRRGYAPLTLCRSCGYRLQCINCTTWLVEHRSKPRLLCHHCGFSPPMPSHCPECQTESSFVACGPGVERVAEEVEKIFPTARVITMTSDMVEDGREMKDRIHQILSHEVDIIVGTQMMAKGHHFPVLTLVGVIDADLGLTGGDLRACEKTYQLLHQVAGRCGRAQYPGKVIIQTYHPTHPVIQALANDQRDEFMTQELQMRNLAGMPPFTRLVSLIISSFNPQVAEEYSHFLRRKAPISQGIEVLGPVIAPLAVIRRRHRWRLLVRAEKNTSLQTYLRTWLQAAGPVPTALKLQVDIDPVSFL
jgi:primosomal protein N' (replication factor Y)